MRVVALKQNNAGNYHRLQLPAKHIDNITVVEELTEDILEDTDILWLHWYYKDVLKLSAWKYKYGFKIILDIDDYWDSSKSSFVSYHTHVLADHIICSTPYISEILEKPKDDITIVPNMIPDIDQFIFNGKPESSKIRVGIMGSSSHHTNWAKLKKFLNTAKRSKELSENLQFVVAGYENTKQWNSLLSNFPDNTVIINAKPYEDYISCLDSMDILLCPLSNSEIDRGRSSIKILEALSRKTIPFASENYFLKGDIPWNPDDFVKKQDWISTLKKYVQDRKALEKDQEETLRLYNKYNNYQEIIQQRISVINQVHNKNYDYNRYSDNLITTIIYDKSQPTDFSYFFNEIRTKKERSYLFEYNVILKLMQYYEEAGYLNGDYKYIGFLSWKFPYKTGYYSAYVNKLLKNKTADIIHFCKSIPKYIDVAEEDHPGLKKMFMLLCEKLGLRFTNNPKHTIYSNFFVAKPNVYLEYTKILKKAIDILETDEELKYEVWKDANYPGLSKKYLYNQTELTYYPFHTFLLERLLSIWIENNNHLKVINL